MLTERETDRIWGFGKLFIFIILFALLLMFISGPNAGKMVAEGLLDIQYGASAEDVPRTTHAHVFLSFILFEYFADCYVFGSLCVAKRSKKLRWLRTPKYIHMRTRFSCHQSWISRSARCLNLTLT